MLALSPAAFTPSRSAEYFGDQELVRLGFELERRKRRARILYQQWRRRNTDHAWQTWSDACADLAQLCERIALVPATTIQGIAIRYEALAVGLLDDDIVMDQAIRQQAALLRQSLARMLSI
jgi:hypothetical protein